MEGMKFEMVKIEELEKKIEQQEIKGIYLLLGKGGKNGGRMFV